MTRNLSFIACLWVVYQPIPARAALDPELKVPYQLRIILRIGDHPHFTEHFRNEFKRDLRAQVQAALGPLGSVELIDLATINRADWEPLWKQVEDKGLEALDPDRRLGGGKTHFVRLDFHDGQYLLQGRQHDGTSGFITPIVRKRATHDRAFVARLASLLIGKDFGLVATLDPTGAKDEFLLKVKASELGPFNHWVKPGEVFAVVAVRQERRRDPAPPAAKGPSKSITVQVGTRVEEVLLQVTGEPTRDGRIPCKMFHRYDEPLPTGGVLGFRCVKLGTVTAPLRLQLVEPGGAPQRQAALQVFAKADDFPDGNREADLTINHDGLHVSKGPFANVAFTRVLLGNRRIARIPIELLDDHPEMRIIRLDPGAELRDRLESERRGLIGRITDGRLIQIRGFHDITALEQADRKADALERGQSVLELLDAMSTELDEEIVKLQARADKELPKAGNFVADAEQQLRILRGKQEELRKHLDALKNAIAEDMKPDVQARRKRVQDMVRTAELMVTQAEYDRALAKYEEALTEVKDEPAVRQRIDAPYQALKKAWAVKEGDAAHAEARRFLREVWPKLNGLPAIRVELTNARKSFEKFKALNDRLAINQMSLAAVEVLARYADEVKKFSDAAMEEEDKKTLALYLQTNEELQKLLREIQAYLQPKK